jgi:DNA end-binding protein Ku
MRSIWRGAVSFGLIYIPVRLYSAVQSEELDFDLIRRGDQCPIHYAKVCRETGEEVPYEEIVRGYEYKKGEYVLLEEEDFKRANAQKTQMIEIVSFVEEDEIDPKYLEKPYYLEPDKGAEKVYALLRSALEKSGKVGVARFVIRTREHLAMLKAEEKVITLNQMRFHSEIRPTDDLKLPGKAGVTQKELDIAVKLVEQLSGEWKPEAHKDTYIEDLKRIIDEKIEGKPAEPLDEEPIPVEVTDLFSKLSESLKLAQQEKSSRR